MFLFGRFLLILLAAAFFLLNWPVLQIVFLFPCRHFNISLAIIDNKRSALIVHNSSLVILVCVIVVFRINSPIDFIVTWLFATHLGYHVITLVFGTVFMLWFFLLTLFWFIKCKIPVQLTMITLVICLIYVIRKISLWSSIIVLIFKVNVWILMLLITHMLMWYVIFLFLFLFHWWPHSESRQIKWSCLLNIILSRTPHLLSQVYWSLDFQLFSHQLLLPFLFSLLLLIVVVFSWTRG